MKTTTISDGKVKCPKTYDNDADEITFCCSYNGSFLAATSSILTHKSGSIRLHIARLVGLGTPRTSSPCNNMKLYTLVSVLLAVILTLDVLGQCEGWWGSSNGSSSNSGSSSSSDYSSTNTDR